jgi:hypothetical protein
LLIGGSEVDAWNTRASMTSGMTSVNVAYSRVTSGSSGAILTTLKATGSPPKKASALCIIPEATQLNLAGRDRCNCYRSSTSSNRDR